MHTCPHCQKPIVIKLNIELITQDTLLDRTLEKEGKMGQITRDE